MTTLSVQTEDGDYLALTGESEKKELNMKEAGTDYSDDYDYHNEEVHDDLRSRRKHRRELWVFGAFIENGTMIRIIENDAMIRIFVQ